LCAGRRSRAFLSRRSDRGNGAIDREVPMINRDDSWPSLPLASWRDTRATLHLWTQVVGKIRLAQAPLVNHWWQVPLYVTARGLTTSAMPYGTRDFQIDFDFIDHRLVIVSSDGGAAGFALEPRSVAEFHREVMAQLASLGIAVKLWTMPVEIEGAIPFEQDHVHSAYDKDAVNRFCALPRQGQPGAFFLGQLRPRRHAVLGKARSPSSRNRAPSRELGDAGSLFT
jgi:hypothetical protein